MERKKSKTDGGLGTGTESWEDEGWSGNFVVEEIACGL